jgi:glycerate kinase
VATGIPTTVLVAPDSFKGTLTAGQVARAVGKGLEASGVPVDLCPVADGGEGTLEALLAPLGGALVTVDVSDLLGRPVAAQFGFVPAEGRAPATAIIETAAASGLPLVAVGERDPLAASTAGTGELIAAPIDSGAGRLLLGVGGSATTDGGAGAIKAIKAAGGLRGAQLTVLCDVRTPFEDAARVFGPQKGAGTDDIKRLNRRLGDLARRLRRDPRGIPMGGAAGGLAGGLWAEFGAELRPGASFVLDELGFDARMRAARAVVSGEGRLDMQSLAGKAVSEVATRARQAGVPSYAMVGTNALDPFGIRILDLQGVFEAGTPAKLTAAGKRLGRTLTEAR